MPPATGRPWLAAVLNPKNYASALRFGNGFRTEHFVCNLWHWTHYAHRRRRTFIVTTKDTRNDSRIDANVRVDKRKLRIYNLHLRNLLHLVQECLLHTTVHWEYNIRDKLYGLIEKKINTA